MDIHNQVAVISGGASGMGAATARALSHAGAKIAILDLNFTQAKTIADECDGLALEVDVTNPEAVEQAITQVKSALGTPRLCILCAGIAPAKRIVGREGALPLEEFNHVINVNLIGTFNVLRLCAREMSLLDPIGTSEERGVIIMTASVAAYEGQIGQAAYSASKGGVVSLTLPAARELSRFGIRVNTVAPGLIGTPMLLGMPQEVQESLAACVPFPKRFGDPAEYAKLVAHIIDNQMINGEVIRLDGALRMQP